jgi:hypothetical protein
VLTLTATLAGGEPLPAWLTFDGARFTGTPPRNFNGAADIVVDRERRCAQRRRHFPPDHRSGERRPHTRRPRRDAVSAEDVAVDIAIPLGAFADVDATPVS